jgi:hypothetical protein
MFRWHSEKLKGAGTTFQFDVLARPANPRSWPSIHGFSGTMNVPANPIRSFGRQLFLQAAVRKIKSALV